MENLSELFSGCEFIEAVAIVDEEGLVISKFVKEGTPYDIEEIASSVVIPTLRMSKAVENATGSSGDLEEIVLFTNNKIIMVDRLAYDTYLVVSMKKNPLYGKARFRVKVGLPKIKASL